MQRPQHEPRLVSPSGLFVQVLGALGNQEVPRWRQLHCSNPLHHSTAGGGDEKGLFLPDGAGFSAPAADLREYFALLPTKRNIERMFQKLEESHKRDMGELRSGLVSFNQHVEEVETVLTTHGPAIQQLRETL